MATSRAAASATSFEPLRTSVPDCSISAFTSLDALAADCASRDQASSISEVTSAVRQLDEMTQHNAALVEETNAAIEQTEAQANELDRIVDVFTLDGEETRRARAA